MKTNKERLNQIEFNLFKLKERYNLGEITLSEYETIKLQSRRRIKELKKLI
jgi:uncharacterized membrane protein